jgi:hypothetical protein
MTTQALETTVTKAEEPVDTFAEAFKLATQDDAPDAASVQPEIAKAAVEEPAPPAPPAPPEQTNFDPVTTEPVVAVEEPKAPAVDDGLMNRFVEALTQKVAAPAPQQTQQQTQQQAPALFTDVEAKLLQDYEADFPEVARAEALRRRAENQVLVQHIFSQVAQALRPIQEALGGVVETTHVENLHKVVPDYDDVRDKVVNWVGTQPAYLRAAYEHVIQEGTVDEVADLITRYRTATGAAPAAAAPVAVTTKKDVELPDTAKRAAAALAPVASKRTAVVRGSDPTDFDGAFSQFAKEL